MQPRLNLINQFATGRLMIAQTLRSALMATLVVAGQHGVALANGFGMPQGGELQQRLADFAATKQRNVIDFQPFRAQQQATTQQGATLTLTSLQPKFNTWFTLDLGQPGQNQAYHLELADPQATTLQLLDDGGAVSRHRSAYPGNDRIDVRQAQVIVIDLGFPLLDKQVAARMVDYTHLVPALDAGADQALGGVQGGAPAE